VLGARSAFLMRLAHRKVGPLSLYRLRFNTEVELDQQPAGSFVLVSTQISGRSQIATCSDCHSGGAGLVVVDSAGRSVTKQFSADSERLIVRIDQQAMRTYCAQLIGRNLDRPLEFAPVIDQAGAAYRCWLSVLKMLTEYCANGREGALAVLVQRQIEELAMLMLLTEHRHSYSDTLRLRERPLAPRHVNAAEDYIEANAAEPLTLAAIAAAVGVSVRSLTSAFREFRDTSPGQYLREVRLNAVRDELRKASPGTTVADVAMRWGFTHLGRFSVDYRRRFGEYPSATLRG
jgi:AraC-like DNA-binding protein